MVGWLAAGDCAIPSLQKVLNQPEMQNVADMADVSVEKMVDSGKSMGGDRAS